MHILHSSLLTTPARCKGYGLLPPTIVACCPLPLERQSRLPPRPTLPLPPSRALKARASAHGWTNRVANCRSTPSSLRECTDHDTRPQNSSASDQSTVATSEGTNDARPIPSPMNPTTPLPPDCGPAPHPTRRTGCGHPEQFQPCLPLTPRVPPIPPPRHYCV